MAIPRTDPTAEPQTLDEVREWRLGVADALVDYRTTVQRAIRTGSAVAPRFVGMTEGDVDAYYDSQRRELDRLTALNLVASAEAAIRIDFFRRVRGKPSTPLAKAYRAWHDKLSFQKQMRPDFDEGGILDTLRDANVVNNHIVGQYRECLRLRHWVGHGRYWAKPVEVDRLGPDEVYNRANALLQAMPP
jgi:hypothetical protein